MSSIVRTGGSNIDRSADLRGLSTDTKPTKAQGDYIPHGSTWYNMDDCTKYMYNEDNDTWYNIPNGGGGIGDMQKSVYDPTNTVANAGGIDTYVGDEINNAKSEIITEVEGNIATTANNLINDTVGWTNKNLLPITLDQLQAINTSGTWEDNVYTYRGITITVDIFNNLITGISVNGANTAGSVVFKLTDNFVYQLLSEDKYYISDGVDTTAIVSGSAYISVERKKGESGESHYLSTNNEERSVKFTVDYSVYDYYFINIYIPNNSSISNAVFYPMIRRASISDDTYEPYTKTVKDEIFNLNSSVGNLKSRVGIAEGNIQTLNSIKANTSDLGTASTKNSTSVVTQSTDLVESGAVYSELVNGEVMLPQNLFINADPKTVEVKDITFVITKDSVNMSGQYASTVSQAINAGRGVNDCLYLPFGEYVVTTSVNDSNAEIFIGGTYNNAFKQLTDSGNFVEFTLDENTQSDFIVDGTVGIAIYAKAISNGVTINTTIYPRIYKKSEYHIPLKDVVPTKADNSVIGTLEDGTNPTKSYAVGEHFIRNGKFCTCIVPVTTESTWSDSYYDEGDVASALDVSTTTVSDFVITRCNKFVTVNYLHNVTVTANDATQIGVIPPGCRPSFVVYGVAITPNADIICRVAINANGNVFVRSTSSFSEAIGFNISYPI